MRMRASIRAAIAAAALCAQTGQVLAPQRYGTMCGAPHALQLTRTPARPQSLIARPRAAHRNALEPSSKTAATASRCSYACASSASCGRRGAGCSWVSREVGSLALELSLAAVTPDCCVRTSCSRRFVRRSKRGSDRALEAAWRVCQSPGRQLAYSCRRVSRSPSGFPRKRAPRVPAL